MVLPRQFWDAYDECTVVVALATRQGGQDAQLALDAVQTLLKKPSESASGAAEAKAYDIDTVFLQLAVTVPSAPAAPRAGRLSQLTHQSSTLRSALDKVGRRPTCALRSAVDKGIRVARPPRVAGPSAVELALSLPVSKFHFEQHISEAFQQALSAACHHRAVKILRVADKPRAFRGGGKPPLPP
jgi:hypothetical protein